MYTDLPVFSPTHSQTGKKSIVGHKGFFYVITDNETVKVDKNGETIEKYRHESVDCFIFGEAVHFQNKIYFD
jgi:hypothetical protein